MTLKNKKLDYPIHIVLLCLGKSIRMKRVNRPRSDQKEYARALAMLIFGIFTAFDLFILCLCFGLLSVVCPLATIQISRTVYPITC